MPADFFSAKNGQLSCKINGRQLHSAYNPAAEAEQFVKSLECSYIPTAIVVTGAGLPYCANPLRSRYPAAKVYAVQYSAEFRQYDAQWDGAIAAHCGGEEDCKVFEQWLDSFITEENYSSVLFISWKPSELCFPDAQRAVWSAIKRYIERCRDVLGTRSFFGRRWLRNSVRFCGRIQNAALLKNGCIPIIFAAAGPSLEAAIPILKKYRNRFFFAAASSALLPLIAADTAPDICISTDGGYWAKKHLDILRCTRIPLAAPDESAVPAQLFETNTIVPLAYDDSAAKELMNLCGIHAMNAHRNGTVSGTAAQFFLNITNSVVGAAGLDLSVGTGNTHARPNALESAASCADTKLLTAETRQAAARCNSGAINIYRSWFSMQGTYMSSRFFRLRTNHDGISDTLGSIQNADIEQFCKALPENPPKMQFFSYTLPDRNERKKKLRSYLQKAENNLDKPQQPECTALIRTVSPAEYAQYVKYNDLSYLNRAAKKTQEFIEQLRKLV
ncbi:MAG: DUF115 domain-containing protein [Bacteroides sp.]|nr:DUF115 domain-containing protein [Prevotella sp.]MCM1407282.1 DUF115 domain-containing protein [Treponema brennaborense]MCM1469770.1 DUF115 domain-containing protein [Bacteroides sp.]